MKEIIQKVNKLQSVFSNDLEISFSYEYLHFRSYIQGIIENNENNLGIVEISLLFRQ